jgi:hypothetical protein
MPAEKSPEQRAIDGKAAPHGPSSDFVRFCWILGTLPRPLQGNAQYVRQLNRYFNQVLGDFGPISTFNTVEFGTCQSDPFERSKGRWMSLAPFLVVLLMELAASPGWVSALFVLSTVSGQDQVPR